MGPNVTAGLEQPKQKNCKSLMQECKFLAESYARPILTLPCKKQQIRTAFFKAILEKVKPKSQNKIDPVALNDLYQDETFGAALVNQTKFTVREKIGDFVFCDFAIYGNESVFSAVRRWNAKIIRCVLCIQLPMVALLKAAIFGLIWDIKRPEKELFFPVAALILYLYFVGIMALNLLFLTGFIIWKISGKAKQPPLGYKPWRYVVWLAILASPFLFSFYVSLFSWLLPLDSSPQWRLGSQGIHHRPGGLDLTWDISPKWQLGGGVLILYVLLFFIGIVQLGLSKEIMNPWLWLRREFLKCMGLLAAIFLISMYWDHDFQLAITDALKVLMAVTLNLFPFGICLSRPQVLRSYRKWNTWNKIQIR